MLSVKPHTSLGLAAWWVAAKELRPTLAGRDRAGLACRESVLLAIRPLLSWYTVRRLRTRRRLAGGQCGAERAWNGWPRG